MVGLLVTGLFLAWALRGVPLASIWAGIRQADPFLLIGAAALATLTFPLRTFRWRVILRDEAGRAYALGPLWRAVSIGFMANNLLPARAGEVARAYVASREMPVRFSTALASIGVERVVDALVMLALMAVAILAPSFPAHATVNGTSVGHLTAGAAAGFGAVLVLALIVVLHPAPWLRLFERAARAVLPARIADRVSGIAEGIVAGLTVLKSPRRLAELGFWSLVVWLVNAASFALCFRAFGLAVPAEGALLLQGIIGFGVAIPSSPGFFGVFELATKVTLEFYGITGSLALAYAFAYHISGFLPIVFLGLHSLSKVHLRLSDLRRTPEPVA